MLNPSLEVMAASKLMASAVSRLFRRGHSRNALKQSSSDLKNQATEAELQSEGGDVQVGELAAGGKRPRSPSEHSNSSSPIRSPSRTRSKIEVEAQSAVDAQSERSICWLEELAGRSITALPAAEIRALICTGVHMPRSHRKMFWSHHFKYQISAKRLEELQLEVPNDTAQLIDLDVPRSLPDRMSSSSHTSLRRVLRGLAALQPEVGYCQGLNNIAAIFVLLGFDERVALSGCLSLLERCCPDYHAPGLEGFLRDAELLQDCVKQLLPEESQQRLADLGVPLEALAAQHFLALGAASSWPISATAQLWDLLVLDGRAVLLASFLALLQLFLPLAVEEDSEPVEVFRMNVRRGVSEDPASFLKLTTELSAKILKD
mmetsp:Transcript_34667/g.62913  ORF Transcript_34667/g.62913 Transcript_34667/m.62913 type:complete len:375 (-) Transcript_34667:96-1220(-)